MNRRWRCEETYWWENQRTLHLPWFIGRLVWMVTPQCWWGHSALVHDMKPLSPFCNTQIHHLSEPTRSIIPWNISSSFKFIAEYLMEAIIWFGSEPQFWAVLLRSTYLLQLPGRREPDVTDWSSSLFCVLQISSWPLSKGSFPTFLICPPSCSTVNAQTTQTSSTSRVTESFADVLWTSLWRRSSTLCLPNVPRRPSRRGMLCFFKLRDHRRCKNKLNIGHLKWLLFFLERASKVLMLSQCGTFRLYQIDGRHFWWCHRPGLKCQRTDRSFWFEMKYGFFSHNKKLYLFGHICLSCDLYFNILLLSLLSFASRPIELSSHWFIFNNPQTLVTFTLFLSSDFLHIRFFRPLRDGE